MWLLPLCPADRQTAKEGNSPSRHITQEERHDVKRQKLKTETP